LNNSRTQGRGLFKIQLQDFKKVRILDVARISPLARIKLRKEAQKLLNKPRENFNKSVVEIDKILIGEYNQHTGSRLSYDELINELNNVMIR